MRCDIDIGDGVLSYRGSIGGQRPSELAVSTFPTAFELTRLVPAAPALYYRLGRSRVELSDDLRELAPDGPLPAPDPGVLLAMIHGLPDAPGATPLPGVQELTLGTRLRVDGDGVRVQRRPPQLAPGRSSLQHTLGRAIVDVAGTELAVAYSGGVASAFVAVCARAAGARPVLRHAELDGCSTPLPAIADLRTQRVRCDLAELLDPDQISGRELTPPLPEAALRHGMTARLRAAAGGTPLVSGALLENLVSTTLPEIGGALWGRRLLTCEPFHRDGVIASLQDARTVLAARGAGMRGRRVIGGEPDEPESQQVGVAPRGPSDDGGLPGLTEAGREALKSARLATGAVWRTHLEGLPTAVGRAEAARHEAGLAAADAGTGGPSEAVLPALDPRVLAAVAALPTRALGRVRGGRFVNQAPLRDVLARAGVGPAVEASSAFRTRLAAASYVHRERRALAAALARDCALADLGLLDPAPVLRLLRDGQATADRALLILRLAWLDRWLRRR